MHDNVDSGVPADVAATESSLRRAEADTDHSPFVLHPPEKMQATLQPYIVLLHGFSGSIRS